MLTINVAHSDSRAPVNEDVVGHCGDAAWVIDGATGIGAGLLDAPSDAAWLARTVDERFRRLLADDPAIATKDLVRRAIESCRDGLTAGALRAAEGPHEYPSAAFAMVRSFGDHVELSGLADCRIAYVDDDGEGRLFSDRSMEAVEGTTLALTREILGAEPAIAPQDLFARLLPRLRANRSRMNRPGGYWVLGTEPAAADHLAQLLLPSRRGRRFALASDGFLRLVELFEVAGPGDLLGIDSRSALDGWLSRLRSIESEPDSCRVHARVKVHDDATFVNIEL